MVTVTPYREIASLPVAAELVVPIYLQVVPKRINLLAVDLQPRSFVGDTRGRLIPYDWVVNSQAVVSPSVQAFEAHVRHQVAKSMTAYQQAWGKPWVYDRADGYAVEILLGTLANNTYDNDNLAKGILDGLTGEGGLFKSDARARLVLIERGGAKRRGFRHGGTVPTVVRVMPFEQYVQFDRLPKVDVGGQVEGLLGSVVAPASMGVFSKSREIGKAVFTSRSEAEAWFANELGSRIRWR